MAPAKNFRLSDSPGSGSVSDPATLWQRIESFSLDDPNAAFPFSRRLAKENRWPIGRAQRAVAEYKKFMFLGCVAGHPVSPSEDVDQVWHLHLTYSESYWKKWCVEILQHPFHHHPTRGGAAESAKFEDWYANTLRSYEKFFGEEPPIDIWPRKPEHHRLAWVDIDAHWILPKPALASLRAIAPAALALFVTGCVGAAGLNVFDYKGSEFLRFYIFFSVIAFAVAIGIRWFAMQSASVPAAIKPEDLDPYELAMLTGADKLAVSAAMMNLEKAGLLMVVNRKLRIVGNIPSTLAPLEGYVAEVCQQSQRMSGVRQVRSACRHFTQGMERSLAARGLLLEGAAGTVNLLLPPLLAWVVPICGWIKVAVGIQRDKPVLYITVLSILTTIIAVLRGRLRNSAPRATVCSTAPARNTTR